MTLAHLDTPAATLPAGDRSPGSRPSTADPAPTAVASAARSQRPVTDVVEDWGLASFPASDPPSNW